MTRLAANNSSDGNGGGREENEPPLPGNKRLPGDVQVEAAMVTEPSKLKLRKREIRGGFKFKCQRKEETQPLVQLEVLVDGAPYTDRARSLNILQAKLPQVSLTT